MKHLTVSFASCLVLGGCSWFSWVPFVGGDTDEQDYDYRRGTIGEFIAKLPPIEVPDVVAGKPSQRDVMEAYRRVYGMMPDALANHSVGKRLADLEMAVGEEKNIAGDADPYRAAIGLYEELLGKDGEDQDAILYQLARAHDIVGEGESSEVYLNRLINEYPDSVYTPEAHFRRAEMSFSRGEFRPAAADYQHVVALGEATPYAQNARYMLGWSQFKLSRLDNGLASFFEVIEQVIAGRETAELTAVERDLVHDTLRVTVLALAYLDGPETLAHQMQRLGKPHWQYLVYERLAADYAEKERFSDSVASLQTYIDHNPLDSRAPDLHKQIVQTLIDADFPSQVRPKKEEFITRYGITSEFWAVHDEPKVRSGYLPTLKTYLAELSKLAHHQAQSTKQRADYLKAAEWYEQIVATFPQDPTVAEYLFLLGEVYTEADEYKKAVMAYQRVVGEFPEFEQAGEAAYAAILGIKAILPHERGVEHARWRRLMIDAQIQFAYVFPNDPRAARSQADAADALFALEDYAQAVKLAQTLLSASYASESTSAAKRAATLEPDIERTALLVVGHGRFELADYVAAEAAYRRLLTLPGFDDIAATEERLLAAVYKQGESAEVAGEMQAALSHYLRLPEISPSAELTIQGHFDAIAVMEATGAVRDAARLLEDFRSRFPGHRLGQDVAKRLAAMYEKTQDSHRAAREYLAMSSTDADPEVRRQSLYRAAELFLEVGDTPGAVQQFRSYANTYAQPKDLRLEAMHHLDELYQTTGEEDKRRFWLRQKIDLHASMGSFATSRAAFLAARAEMVFALDDKTRFARIRLNHPLKASLKRKTVQLKRTVDAFERVASYKVEELATAATYQIGDLYATLSRDILSSDRPGDLSQLELQQYEILLEEQAFPFEEQAISIHEINMRRSWEGTYDEFVEKSFAALAQLMPARFDKQEIQVAYVDTVF